MTTAKAGAGPYIKIFGGLGNQLFQYSYGESLREGGVEPRYIVDAAMDDLVSIFDLPEAEITRRGSLAAAALKAYARFVAKRYAADFFQDRLPSPSLRRRLSFRRQKEYRRSGFFAEIDASEAVAVHVRGGDYLGPSTFHGWGDVCDARYYEEAVDIIAAAVAEPRFFLFTDDERFALSMLPPGLRSRMTTVRGEFEDDPGFHLFLMKTCRHNIIANSTFSWWGAFLGEPEGRRVVAPAKWDRFVCPPEWRRI